MYVGCFPAGGEAGRRYGRQDRCRSSFGKMIGWLESHFSVPSHEPQLEFSAIEVSRRGRGVNVPALAALAAGGAGLSSSFFFSAASTASL